MPNQYETESLTGMLIGLGWVLIIDDTRGLPLLSVFVCLIGLMLYSRWASTLPRISAKALAVAEQFPQDLSLTWGNQTIDLKRNFNRPCLWIFLHGLWCPCSAIQLRALARYQNVFKKVGLDVFCVSTGFQQGVDRLAPNVFAPVLDDSEGALGQALGLYLPDTAPWGIDKLGHSKHGHHPCFVLTGVKGEILYYKTADNYRMPPDIDIEWPKIQQLLKQAS